jgi:hypothetical protein
VGGAGGAAGGGAAAAAITDPAKSVAMHMPMMFTPRAAQRLALFDILIFAIPRGFSCCER